MHNLHKHIPSYSHGEDKLHGLDLENTQRENVQRFKGCRLRSSVLQI